MLKDAKKLGEEIKSFRNEKGWTQKELATKLNVTDSAVSNWETGTTNIALDICEALADLMGLSLDRLLRVSETKKVHEIYETITLDDLTVDIINVYNSEGGGGCPNIGCRITVELHNNSSRLTQLKHFQYQLINNNNQIMKEVTQLVYNSQLDEDVNTTEKLSKIPAFIDGNATLQLELIFTGSIYDEATLTFVFHNESKVVLLRRITTDFIFSGKYLDKPNSRQYLETYFDEALKFLIKHENYERAFQFIKNAFSELTYEDIKKYNIPINKNILCSLGKLISNTTIERIYADKYVDAESLFRLEDDVQLNQILEKNFESFSQEVLSIPGGSLLGVALHNLSRLNKNNFERIIGLMGKLKVANEEIEMSVLESVMYKLLQDRVLTSEHHHIIMANLNAVDWKTICVLYMGGYPPHLADEIVLSKKILLTNREILKIYKETSLPFSVKVRDHLFNKIKFDSFDEFNSLKSYIGSELIKKLLDEKIIPFEYLTK